MSLIIFSNSCSIPSPVFPETHNISSFLKSNVRAISVLSNSISPVGKSILFITGIIFRPASKAL